MSTHGSLTAGGSSRCGPDRAWIGSLSLSATLKASTSRQVRQAAMLDAGRRGGGARLLGLGGECPPVDSAGDLAVSSLHDKFAGSARPGREIVKISRPAGWLRQMRRARGGRLAGRRLVRHRRLRLPAGPADDGSESMTG